MSISAGIVRFASGMSILFLVIFVCTSEQNERDRATKDKSTSGCDS